MSQRDKEFGKSVNACKGRPHGTLPKALWQCLCACNKGPLAMPMGWGIVVQRLSHLTCQGNSIHLQQENKGVECVSPLIKYSGTCKDAQQPWEHVATNMPPKRSPLGQASFPQSPALERRDVV